MAEIKDGYMVGGASKEVTLKSDMIDSGLFECMWEYEAGDVDAILVHSRSAEEAFGEGGFGSHRTELMDNDFGFFCPKEDPAGIATSDAAAGALTAIAQTEANFVSRGDDSGTHKKELSLWAEAGLDPAIFGDWPVRRGHARRCSSCRWPAAWSRSWGNPMSGGSRGANPHRARNRRAVPAGRRLACAW